MKNGGDKMNINQLVVNYQESNNDELFNEIYEIISKSIFGTKDGNPYLRKVAKSLKADFHSVKAMFDDTLINAIKHYKEGNEFIHYFKRSWRQRRANIYNKAKWIRENETPEEQGSEGLSLFDTIPDSHSIEEIVLAKKKADQRQLIDFLVAGENERTTAIVQAFLTTELKTPTAIGNHLGLDHKQVSRAIKRLAGKFDSKQFGEVSDYLVAL
jgi:hypothetical protein